MSDNTIDFSGRKINLKDIYSLSFSIEKRRVIGIPITRETISITFESGQNSYSAIIDSLADASELARRNRISKIDIKPPLYTTTLKEFSNRHDETQMWLFSLHKMLLTKKNSYRVFQLEDGKITKFGFIYD